MTNISKIRYVNLPKDLLFELIQAAVVLSTFLATSPPRDTILFVRSAWDLLVLPSKTNFKPFNGWSILPFPRVFKLASILDANTRSLETNLKFCKKGTSWYSLGTLKGLRFGFWVLYWHFVHSVMLPVQWYASLLKHSSI